MSESQGRGPGDRRRDSKTGKPGGTGGDSRRQHAERGGRDRDKAPWKPSPERRGGPAREARAEVPEGPDLRSVRTRHDDPPIAEDVMPAQLDKGARIQLKTLEKSNADEIAKHLVMAARLIDEDPELAHRHALSASRRGGRIAVVRETLAITAYATGDFALALRELRTYRRISGSNDQLPLMVDSERGVGRPDRALELGRSIPRETLDAAVRVELAIAMSGARLDLGQPDAALGELEIPELDRNTAFSYSPDLFRAYGEVLEELGRDAEAESWRERADAADDALNASSTPDDTIEIVDLESEEASDGAADGAQQK